MVWQRPKKERRCIIGQKQNHVFEKAEQVKLVCSVFIQVIIDNGYIIGKEASQQPFHLDKWLK